MSDHDQHRQEQRIDEILFLNTDDATKVQLLIKQGLDPELADEIVSRHMQGASAPVYYERLDFADIEDEPKSDRKVA